MNKSSVNMDAFFCNESLANLILEKLNDKKAIANFYLALYHLEKIITSKKKIIVSRSSTASSFVGWPRPKWTTCPHRRKHALSSTPTDSLGEDFTSR